jgi:hypothetical protein
MGQLRRRERSGSIQPGWVCNMPPSSKGPIKSTLDSQRAGSDLCGHLDMAELMLAITTWSKSCSLPCSSLCSKVLFPLKAPNRSASFWDLQGSLLADRAGTQPRHCACSQGFLGVSWHPPPRPQSILSNSFPGPVGVTFEACLCQVQPL